MDSSERAQLKAAFTDEEASKRRISLKRAAPLLGRSYPSVLRLKKNRQIICVQVGGQFEVTLGEIRRFLSHGNATEADWQRHESQ